MPELRGLVIHSYSQDVALKFFTLKPNLREIFQPFCVDTLLLLLLLLLWCACTCVCLCTEGGGGTEWEKNILSGSRLAGASFEDKTHQTQHKVPSASALTLFVTAGDLWGPFISAKQLLLRWAPHHPASSPSPPTTLSTSPSFLSLAFVWSNVSWLDIGGK